MHIPLATLIELMHECSEAALATNASQFPGYPYASAVPWVVDSRQRPLFLFSRLAEHSVNLLADARVSIVLARPGEEPVLERGRASLIGNCQQAQPSEEDIERYLRYQPEASRYLALGDFQWFRMELKQARYVGGFARMGWLKEDDLRLPPPAFAEDEALHTSLSRMLPAGVALLGVDCWGLDMLYEGRRLRRSFPHLVNSSGELEAATAKMGRELLTQLI